AQVLPLATLAASPAEPLRGLGTPERALLMLQVVPMWLRLLVWPARLRADYPAEAFALPPQLELRAAIGLAIILLFALVARSARKWAPSVSFGIAWAAIALLPVSNIVPTGVVLAERTLFLPSIGFVLAVGPVAAQVAAAPLLPRSE